MARRASAFASSSDAALRLPDALDDATTAKAITATRATMSTSRKLFMAFSVPTGNAAEPGPDEDLLRMRSNLGQGVQTGLGTRGVVCGAGATDTDPSDDAPI